MHQSVDATKCRRSTLIHYMNEEEAKTAQPPFYAFGRRLTKGTWLNHMLKKGVSEEIAKNLVTCGGQSLYE